MICAVTIEMTSVLTDLINTNKRLKKTLYHYVINRLNGRSHKGLLIYSMGKVASLNTIPSPSLLGKEAAQAFSEAVKSQQLYHLVVLCDFVLPKKQNNKTFYSLS